MTSHLLKGLLTATLACAPALAAPAVQVSWDCGTMAPFLSPPTECALNGLMLLANLGLERQESRGWRCGMGNISEPGGDTSGIQGDGRYDVLEMRLYQAAIPGAA